MTVLVDTDVLIDYLRGQRDAAAFLYSLGEPPMVSVITLAELWAGARPGEEARLRQALQVLRLAKVDATIAERAGRLRRQFGPSHGTSLPDALIAATAVELGLTLVTLNERHFPMVEKLLVPYRKPAR